MFYNADAVAPALLWLLRCGVEDGRGQAIGERLVAIQHSGGNYHKTQPYALLDLKAPEGAQSVPAELRQAAVDEDAIINWSLDSVTPEYFREINSRRERELAIKEKYVRKSLQFLISESAKKIAKYDAQLRQLRLADDPKRLSLQGNRAQEEERRATLSQRLKDRLAEIDAERHLSEKPPDLIGVAVILPPPRDVVAAVEGMESDPEVEAIAVDVA